MLGSSGRPLPAADLDHVVEHAAVWEDLRGARIFVTGGTGFFGRWMVESFLRASDELDLGGTVVLLTRDARRFAGDAPHVTNHPAVVVHEGDVRTFTSPAGAFSHVLHLATESGPGWSPAASFRTAVEGTERVLAFAASHGGPKLLFSSSGAVYGPQPPDCERLSEEHPAAPRADDPEAGYAEGKRAAEHLCSLATSNGVVDGRIARCFAFVGPLLPLNANFAIGNFIRDALAGDAIDVAGDGTARRSYLYAADLAVWLWTILAAGRPGRSYNVGSEDDLSIREIAIRVADVVRPGTPVRVQTKLRHGSMASRYVPSTARARDELGVSVRVALNDAILRTAQWQAP